LIQEEESAIPVALHRSTSQIPYHQTNEDEEFDNLNDVGLYIYIRNYAENT
jgi:CMP-2-keto-3-deoxyoctulosonic acid synthetase